MLPQARKPSGHSALRDANTCTAVPSMAQCLARMFRPDRGLAGHHRRRDGAARQRILTKGPGQALQGARIRPAHGGGRLTQAVRVALPSGGGAKAIWRSLWLVAAYWIAGRVSLLLADPQVLLSAVWLPSGIAMAATLRYGWAMLPAIYIADVLTGVSFGTPLQASIGIGVAAVVEAALGAHLLRRGGHFAREACGVRDVAGLIAYGAVAAPLAAGLIGTAACVAAASARS